MALPTAPNIALLTALYIALPTALNIAPYMILLIASHTKGMDQLKQQLEDTTIRLFEIISAKIEIEVKDHVNADTEITSRNEDKDKSIVIISKVSINNIISNYLILF